MINSADFNVTEILFSSAAVSVSCHSHKRKYTIGDILVTSASLSSLSSSTPSMSSLPSSENRIEIVNSSTGPTKKRRKGATRLSCAECRRCLRLSTPPSHLIHIKGLNCGATAQFHVDRASNVDVEPSVPMSVVSCNTTRFL